MQMWEAVFVVIAAVAIVLQAVILLALYVELRRLGAVLTQVATTVESRLSPVLSRVERLLEESHGQMRDIVNDTAEIVRMVKSNGQRFDRVLEEAADRLRLQVIRADQLVTGALETVEDTGAELRKSLLGSVRTTMAVVRGVRAGIEFFRGRNRMPERRRETEDEGLFI